MKRWITSSLISIEARCGTPRGGVLTASQNSRNLSTRLSRGFPAINAAFYASNPIRIEVSFSKSLVDTSLIGTERAASLQQQDGLFKLARFEPKPFCFCRLRDIHDRYLLWRSIRPTRSPTTRSPCVGRMVRRVLVDLDQRTSARGHSLQGRLSSKSSHVRCGAESGKSIQNVSGHATGRCGLMDGVARHGMRNSYRTTQTPA